MAFEIVTIGDCTLYRADCMDVLPTLNRMDALVTDPPYGISKKLSGGGGRCENWTALLGKMAEWDTHAPHELINKARAICDNAIIWGGNYFELPPSRGFLIWDKGSLISGRSFAECEMAWCSMDMNARIKKVNPPTLVKHHRHEEKTKVHPTQKPLEIMEWCLSFLPDAKTIFDPFMGSGTTGLACVRAGKEFIGIEKDAEYFDIACKRIEAAYAQPDMFIAPPDMQTYKQELML